MILPSAVGIPASVMCISKFLGWAPGWAHFSEPVSSL